MKLSTVELNRLCDIAIEAALQSGALIQSYAGRDYAIEDKRAGSSPASQIVTEVDLKSQVIILNHVNPTLATFELGLLIEESDDDLSRLERDYFWCIDPLDGTLPFVQQRPGYAVSIALVSREGTAVVGVIYDPLSETLYHAIRGCGAFRNKQPWTINSTYNGQSTEVYKGGAVLNACWVLDRAPAYFLKKPKEQEGGGCLWDYAATVCLFEEMGGFACDMYGDALDLNSRDSLFMNRKGVLFASHKEVYNSIKTPIT